MCQIQLIFNTDKEKLNNTDINEFIKLMMLGNVNNSDSFGYFNSFIEYKDSGDFVLENLDLRLLKESNFVIGHNRYATGNAEAKKNRNNHPFIFNDFVLVHNGVIDNNKELRNKYNMRHKIKTDSFTVLYMISKEFEKDNSRISREKKIIKAIKKTTKQLDGSYSIFLYDRREDQVYYFKNAMTSFTFALLNHNILVGTTDYQNLNYIYLNKEFKQDIQEIKIEDDHIYKIHKNKLKQIGKFKDGSGKYEGYDNKRLGSTDFWADDFETSKDLSVLEFSLKDMFGFMPEYEVNDNKQLIIRECNEVLGGCYTYFKENAEWDREKEVLTIDLDSFLDVCEKWGIIA